MSLTKRIGRNFEKDTLKSEIKRMLAEIGVSKELFFKTMPRMNGAGYKYSVNQNGGLSSLRQKYTFLKEIHEFRMKEKEKENEK